MVASIAAPQQATDALSAYRGDLASYSRDCLRIVTKDAALVPLDFNFAQRHVHRRVSRQMRETGRVRALVLKARQEGVSTYSAARGYRRVNLYTNQNALVIADQKKRGGILFAIYEGFHRHLPAWIRPRKRYAQKATQLWYDTPDGTGLNSKIAVETASDVQAGRGSTIHYLHASEFAFWEHPDEAYVALMQAIPDQGSEVIIESTASGVGNLFHQMWEAAEAGENGFIAIFLPWWVHEEYRVSLTPVRGDEMRLMLTDWEERALTEGIEWIPPEDVGSEALDAGATWNAETGRWTLSLEQLAWRRQTIRDKLQGDERMFRQEYPSTAREAFLVSGNCFFEEEMLLRHEEHAREAAPPTRANLLWVNRGIVPAPNPRGHLRQWERPDLKCSYVIWADTATGKQVSAVEKSSILEAEAEKGGRDFSCATVICTAHKKIVASLHGRITPEHFAEQLFMLGFLYSNPKAGWRTSRTPAWLAVERNHSSGETVLKILRDELQYPSLYYHRQINRRTKRISNVLGWQTTQENRQVMLDQFAQALREDLLEVLDIDLIRECFTFIRANKDGKPAAQEGCHDDRVMSAAGAWQLATAYHPPASSGWERLKDEDEDTEAA